MAFAPPEESVSTPEPIPSPVPQGAGSMPTETKPVVGSEPAGAGAPTDAARPGAEIAAYQLILSTLRARIVESIRYPAIARANGWEGTVVVAETQTAGRGRLGRTWHSPPATNLYCSVLLRPALAPAVVPQLALSPLGGWLPQIACGSRRMAQA